MPNKTIYVSDDDVPLFEQAQRLASGSLSAAIAAALRLFVEEEEAHMQGFEEVTVQVGKAGNWRSKRFFGRPLARWVHRTSSDHIETFSVYRTRKGNYAVHVAAGPNWSDWANPAIWMDPETWPRLVSRWCQPFAGHTPPWQGWQFGHSLGRGSAESSLDVYEDFESLRQNVPHELADLVEENERGPEEDKLDI